MIRSDQADIRRYSSGSRNACARWAYRHRRAHILQTADGRPSPVGACSFIDEKSAGECSPALFCRAAGSCTGGSSHEIVLHDQELAAFDELAGDAVMGLHVHQINILAGIAED